MTGEKASSSFLQKRTKKLLSPRLHEIIRWFCNHILWQNGRAPPGRRGSKSFLVLFYKKELLAFLLLMHSAQAAPLKFTTWNLDWLTTRTHAEADLPRDVHTRNPDDFIRLAAYARKLDADVIGFQEVDGPQAAQTLFNPAEYTILTIAEPVTQRVGIAVRHAITVTRNPDVTALDVEPDAIHKLRDGLDVTLTLPGGQKLRILVIHLKTGCQTDAIATSPRPQCVLLARQIPVLAAWVAARRREAAAFLVMGDFNRVLDEPEELGAALATAAPLTRVTAGLANPCWDGAPFIDHILAGGPARAWLIPGTLRVQVFQEAGEKWRQHLSDHCPVSVTLDSARP